MLIQHLYPSIEQSHIDAATLQYVDGRRHHHILSFPITLLCRTVFAFSIHYSPCLTSPNAAASGKTITVPYLYISHATQKAKNMKRISYSQVSPPFPKKGNSCSCSCSSISSHLVSSPPTYPISNQNTTYHFPFGA